MHHWKRSILLNRPQFSFGFTACSVSPRLHGGVTRIKGSGRATDGKSLMWRLMLRLTQPQNVHGEWETLMTTARKPAPGTRRCPGLSGERGFGYACWAAAPHPSHPPLCLISPEMRRCSASLQSSSRVKLYRPVSRDRVTESAKTENFIPRTWPPRTAALRRLTRATFPWTLRRRRTPPGWRGESTCCFSDCA